VTKQNRVPKSAFFTLMRSPMGRKRNMPPPRFELSPGFELPRV
jgi:hypothetical protein